MKPLLKGYEDGVKCADDGFVALANAIVIQAAADYRSLSRKPEFEDSYEERKRLKKLNEVEDFFNSSYGRLLSRGNSEYIWENLQAEFE